MANKVLGSRNRVVTILVLTAVCRAPTAGAQPREELLPDTSGAIGEILLQYDPLIEEGQAAFYTDLFAQLPSDVDVTVLCPSRNEVREFCSVWGAYATAGGRSVRVVNVGIPITIWARDRVLARRFVGSSDPAGSLVPQVDWGDDEYKDNEIVAYFLGTPANVLAPVVDFDLELEGGNVVSNDREVFVGSNVIGDNCPDPATCDAAEVLQQAFGRHVTLLSDDHGLVPWVHADMYFTPMGNGTVLVASPELAVRVFGGECNEGDSYEPASQESADDDGESADPFEAGWCAAPMMQVQCDEIARHARTRGYRVVRLPAIASPNEQWMITYNNVLLDERDGRRTVYMPVYGIPELDGMAEAAYAELGIEVRTLDVSGIYRHGGAVRCVTNVLRREDDRGRIARLSRGDRSPGLHIIDLVRSNDLHAGRVDRIRMRQEERNAGISLPPPPDRSRARG